jgi:hypothetical protein
MAASSYDRRKKQEVSVLKFKTKMKEPQVEAEIAEVAETAKIIPLSPYAELVDQVGALTEEAAPILAEIAALQAKLAPLAEKRAELQQAFDAMGDDDETPRLGGVHFIAEAGKRGTSRSIKDMQLVKKLMGSETFMKVATVKLGDIDKYLTLPQRDQVIATARTSRTVKIARKP